MPALRPRTIGVVAFKPKPLVLNALKQLLAWAQGKPVRLCFYFENSTKGFPAGTTPRVDEKGLARCDLVLAFGGDGTLLSSARILHRSRTPIAGINVGGLGFLTDISFEQLEASLDQILAGRYQVVERMMLDVEVWRKQKLVWRDIALNEAVVSKTGIRKLLDINTWSGKDFISRFWVDGLIIATPTGSTAYSLSAGGPLLYPSLEVIALTPICPHALTERPMVLPVRRTLRIVIAERKPQAVVSVDGKDQFRLLKDDEVRISRSKEQTRLAKIGQANHFDMLRDKLKWSKK